MTIILLHSHYDKNHLSEVTEQMRELGAPRIRGIWDETRGMWIALEGCHRIRAAKALDLTPVMVDVGTYDEDGYVDHDAMGEVEINDITDTDNVQDLDKCIGSVGEHLDYIGRAHNLAVIDFTDND